MHRSSLSKLDRIHLARLFADCPRVDISIDCVLQDQMGKAYLDDLRNPRAALIQTGAFCYFGGDPTTEASLAILRRFPDCTILMPSSPGWIEAFKEVHGEDVCSIERYLLDESSLRREHLTALLAESPHLGDIAVIDEEMADNMMEDGMLLANLLEFDSGADFVQRGMGYYIPAPRGVGAVGYSSLVSNDAIEISLFVQPELRRQGIATALASKLIIAALDQGRAPHWDASNKPSQLLAQKLGYTAAGAYHSHCLDH